MIKFSLTSKCYLSNGVQGITITNILISTVKKKKGKKSTFTITKLKDAHWYSLAAYYHLGETKQRCRGKNNKKISEATGCCCSSPLWSPHIGHGFGSTRGGLSSPSLSHPHSPASTAPQPSPEPLAAEHDPHDSQECSQESGNRHRIHRNLNHFYTKCLHFREEWDKPLSGVLTFLMWRG